jgi:hypothetical protein
MRAVDRAAQLRESAAAMLTCDRCDRKVHALIPCSGIEILDTKATSPTRRRMLVCSKCYAARDFGQRAYDMRRGAGDVRQLALPGLDVHKGA